MKYDDGYIYTESLHGASVGVKAVEMHKVLVKFSNFAATDKPDNYRGVANLDMCQIGDTEITVILRVYFTKEEAKNQNLQIHLEKEGKFTPRDGDRGPLENHDLWAGYLQIELGVGDPPIAVG